MVQFSPTDLSQNAQNHLNALQNAVDELPTREAQYAYAADLWKNRGRLKST